MTQEELEQVKKEFLTLKKNPKKVISSELLYRLILGTEEKFIIDFTDNIIELEKEKHKTR